MTQLGAVLGAKLRIACHSIAAIRNESRLKTAVVSVSALLLWVGALALFFEGFAWLKRFGADLSGVQLNIGDIIMARVLAVFSLALFLMLIFSNVLVAFATLYRSREVAYLLQSPLPLRGLFLARFLECVTFSSWASAYLGSPLLLAYGFTTGAPWGFYVAAAAYYVPYVVVPAAIGSILAMAVVRVIPGLPRGSVIAAAVLALGGLFVYLRMKLSAANLSEDTFLTTILEAAGKTQSPLLPSHWAAHGILAAAGGRYRDALLFFLLLLSNALMATWIAGEAAHRLFFAGWSGLEGRERARLKLPGRGLLGWVESTCRFLGEPMRSLVLKDIRLFWRDPVQWTQFIVFFGIMAAYVANLRNRSMTFQNEVFRSWVICLNIAACTLILGTLTSRFVYPLISLEGRRFWVLGLAPLTFRCLVRQKFWLSVATTAAFSVGLVVLSSVILRVEAAPFVLSVYSIILTNFTMSGMAVGFGALYANFHEDNPARIVSGMGGTLNFILSIGYIVLVVGAQTVVLQWRVLGRYARPETFWWALAGVVLFVTALSVAGTVIPLRLGLKSLNDREF